MSEVMEAALEYRNKYGLSVIPLNPSEDKDHGKKPLIAWSPYMEKLASETEIRSWWKTWPTAMVGIVTGKLSGIFVVDGDTDEAIARVEELVGEIVTVTCTSPRGQHWYFKYHEGVRNSQKDAYFHVRGEGGYVAAPPSKKMDGKKYCWILSPDDVPVSEAPDSIISSIFGVKNAGPIPESGRDENGKSEFQGSLFHEGNRDRSLFYTACSLFRGGMVETQVREIIYRMAQACVPPFNEAEAEIKIQSAKSTTSRSNRNWMADVQRYVNSTDGYFNTQDVYSAMGAMNLDEKNSVRSVLQDLKDSKVLEKYGKKTGEYRRLNEDIQVMDFMNAPTNEFKIDLPLGIHNLCSIYPGNIIVFAGSKSAGKTGFMLNIVWDNRLAFKKEDIVYMNSEMGDTELRKRLSLFDHDLKEWKFTPISRASSWSDLITGERKIFIIDYLEMTDQFWLVSEEIRKIHEKLRDGVAVIALQKDPHATLGRGGSFSMEKSRLYVTLDMNLARIVDAKAYKNDINPRGFENRFSLAKGCIIRSRAGWCSPAPPGPTKENTVEDRRYGTN